MRQRKLGSHTPPCHRRMVITTLFSVLLAALQRRPLPRGGGRCEGAPGVRRLPSPGCPPVGRAARARRSLAEGAGVWVWLCRPSVGRAAGCLCVSCAWCLCGVCVFVWVRRGAMCAMVLSSSLAPVPPSRPLPRAVVRAVVLWLVAVPLALVRPLPCWCGTLLLLYSLRRFLPFPLPPAGRPSTLAHILPCLPCVLVCGSAFSFAYFLVVLVLSVVCGHGFSPLHSPLVCSFVVL